jgi:hypothetical protein
MSAGIFCVLDVKEVVNHGRWLFLYSITEEEIKNGKRRSR